MAFSDARNERDRAETGRNSSNHGNGGGGGKSGSRGTLSQQQDRRNLSNAQRVGNRAPGVKGPAPSQYDSRVQNPRYQQNLIASGPLTPHNMWEAFKAMPTSGFGAVSTMLGALGVPGLGPDYEGVTPRSATGFSYDPKNTFGTTDSAMFRNPGVQGIQAAGQPRPPTPPMQGINPLQMPAGQLNVPGPSQYGVNLPSYGYFGQPPALQRPKSAIMGGI